MKHLFSFLFSLTFSSVALCQIIVHDINKTGSSSPEFLTVLNDKLYLYANDSAHGYELWSIDTSNGAQLVADINPGTKGIVANYPISEHKLSVVFDSTLNKSVLLFVADDGVKGAELYGYDGTSTPFLVNEFVPGSGGVHSATTIVSVGQNIYFYDRNIDSLRHYNLRTKVQRTVPNSNFANLDIRLSTFNDKLYISNRRGGQSHFWEYNPITDSIKVIVQNTIASQVEVFYNKLYFTDGYGQLYEYDGVNPAKVVVPHCDGPYNDRGSFGGFNGKVYYNANDSEIYEYDPLTQNTKFIDEPSKKGDSKAYQFTEVNGKMYFVAKDDKWGSQMYVWDGSNKPHILVLRDSLKKNYGSSYPYNFHGIGRYLFFVGSGYGANAGIEVYQLNTDKPTTNVVNLEKNITVKTYPNPTSRLLNIELDLHQAEDLYIDVYDVYGKRVLSITEPKQTIGKLTIDMNVSNLSVGMYFFQISNKKEHFYTGKFFKQ